MRRFGIEIETEGRDQSRVASLLRSAGIDCQAMGYTHSVTPRWKTVTDGSLNGASCELVSPPLPLNNAGFREVKKALRALNGDDAIRVSRRCGVHVHIEATAMTTEHVANTILRYRKYEEKIDKFMPPSRRKNTSTYCKSLKRKANLRRVADMMSVENIAHLWTSRYYKINMKSYLKYGTMEFRQHGGSTDPKKIINWIKFLNEFIEASKPVPATPATDLLDNLNGQPKTVVEEIIRQNGEGTLQTIASEVGCTTGAVRAAIWRARTNGVTVTCRQSKYTAGSTAGATCPNLPFWTGISRTVKEFLTARANHFGFATV